MKQDEVRARTGQARQDLIGMGILTLRLSGPATRILAVALTAALDEEGHFQDLSGKQRDVLKAEVVSAVNTATQEAEDRAFAGDGTVSPRSLGRALRSFAQECDSRIVRSITRGLADTLSSFADLGRQTN